MNLGDYSTKSGMQHNSCVGNLFVANSFFLLKAKWFKHQHKLIYSVLEIPYPVFTVCRKFCSSGASQLVLATLVGRPRWTWVIIESLWVGSLPSHTLISRLKANFVWFCSQVHDCLAFAIHQHLSHKTPLFQSFHYNLQYHLHENLGQTIGNPVIGVLLRRPQIWQDKDSKSWLLRRQDSASSAFETIRSQASVSSGHAPEEFGLRSLIEARGGSGRRMNEKTLDKHHAQ